MLKEIDDPIRLDIFDMTTTSVKLYLVTILYKSPHTEDGRFDLHVGEVNVDWNLVNCAVGLYRSKLLEHTSTCGLAFDLLILLGRGNNFVLWKIFLGIDAVDETAAVDNDQ